MADEEPRPPFPDGSAQAGDGVPDACDNCPPDACDDPADCANTNQADADHDGAGDVCDSCPLSANHDDLDGDGCPDGCDPCLGGLEDGGAFCGDRDQDGFCNSVDNCDERPNTQRNANEDAELAHDALVFGNACDPVPVAEVLEMPKGKKIAFCSIALYNTFGLRPLASHPSEIGATVTTPQNVPPAGQRRVITPVRFCHDRDDLDCRDAAAFEDAILEESSCATDLACTLQVLSGSGLGIQESPMRRFHRLRFGADEANGLDPDGDPARLLYSRAAWTSDADGNPVAGFTPDPAQELAPSFTWTWDFTTDFDRWTTTGVMFPPGEEPAAAEDLACTLWVHSETEVGDTDLSRGTGLHGDQLANEHLLDFRPFRVRCGSGIFAASLIPDKIITLLSLPDPAPFDPAPFRRPGSTVGESDVIMRHVTTPSLWGALDGDGEQAVSVTELFGANLLSLLDDPATLIVNAAEPVVKMGAGLSFPHAVFLNRIGGEQILGTVTGDHRRLGTDGDRPSCEIDAVGCRACPSGLCSPGTLSCCDLACVNDADCASGECSPEGICRERTRAGSPHATGYAAVLTRMRRGVFVVGGADVATGLPTGEIWFASLEGGDWVEVASPIRPGKTHAASYSFASQRLYFVDELSEVPPDPNAGSSKKATVCHVAGGSGKTKTLSVGKNAVGAHLAHGDALGPCPEATVRLVEVGLEPLSARVLLSHPLDQWEQFFLSVDLTGALLFSASSRAKQRHRIARFALAGPEPLLAGARSGHGALAIAPVVDVDGYTLVFHHDEDDGEDEDDGDEDDDDDVGTEPQTLVRVRKRSLDLHPATLASLSEGP